MILKSTVLESEIQQYESKSKNSYIVCSVYFFIKILLNAMRSVFTVAV
jgi:hypothetical protein